MKDFVKETKKKYPKGTRIKLILMKDPFHPVAPGTEGTVESVDDMGTIHTQWDNGRALGLVPGEDTFEKIDEGEKEFDPHNDKIFLLSREEYELTKNEIKKYCPFYGNSWWWLRSPNDNYSSLIRVVCLNGHAYYDFVDSTGRGVAVAFYEVTDKPVGTRKEKYDFSFVYVGYNLWVSESFIFWGRFDEKSNGYETSEIRQKLIKWTERREQSLPCSFN